MRVSLYFDLSLIHNCCVISRPASICLSTPPRARRAGAGPGGRARARRLWRQHWVIRSRALLIRGMRIEKGQHTHRAPSARSRAVMFRGEGINHQTSLFTILTSCSSRAQAPLPRASRASRAARRARDGMNRRAARQRPRRSSSSARCVRLGAQARRRAAALRPS